MVGSLEYIVLMHVYNEAEFLGGVIRSINNQSKPPTQIIIINDESTDQTQDIIEAYTTHHRYLTHNEVKPAFVRRAEAFNAGLDYIREKIDPFDGLLKVDGDIILPRNYAEELLRHLHEPHTAAVSGISTEYRKTRNLNNGAVMYRLSTIPKAKLMNGWDQGIENELISNGFNCYVDPTVSYTDLRPVATLRPSKIKVIRNRLNRKLSKIKGAARKREK